MNDGETASEITLAGNSLAEHDEKQGRADGCACIALGKGFGPYLKARETLAAESSQRHDRRERLGRQRQ